MTEKKESITEVIEKARAAQQLHNQKHDVQLSFFDQIQEGSSSGNVQNDSDRSSGDVSASSGSSL